MTVWDSVLFNDELDLLEIRLRTLADVVDRFVVVEADHSFTGVPKPLHVKENLARFARWSDKMLVVSLALGGEPAEADLAVELAEISGRAQLPQTGDLLQSSARAWAREHAQERAQEAALRDAGTEDLILIGDVDEIPHPHVVEWLARQLVEPLRLQQRHAIYRANWVMAHPFTIGTYACRGSDLGDPRIRAMLGHRDPGPSLPETELADAGWHFSYLGTPADIRAKLAAFSHQEFNNERDSGLEHLQRCQHFRVHFNGLSLLSATPHSSLDEVQQNVLAVRPDFFDFTPQPAIWWQAAWRTWTWLRRGLRLPGAVVAAIDGEGLSFRAVSPLLVAIDALRALRRSRRPLDWDYKCGKVLPAVPSAGALMGRGKLFPATKNGDVQAPVAGRRPGVFPSQRSRPHHQPGGSAKT